MDGTIVELLNGIEVIRITDSISLEESRFENKSEFLRKKEMKHHKQMAKYDCWKFINEVTFTVLMIGISAYLATQGIISVGAVLTSYLCFSQLIKPLEELHRILDELSESVILADDFFKLAEIPNDFSYTEVNKATSGPNIISPFINIKDLHFSYDNQASVLKNLNLAFEKGSFTGIAGPSGCGKSSFIKAVCKLEQYGGEIFIDGVDLRSLSRKELSRIIALVPQSPFIVAGTIYENICYGLDRMPSQKEVENAVRKACLTEFIDSLPNKLNTVLSENGGNLSGGQKQRIAIARIFLRKPEILILDEATSALDNTSERYIQNEIEKLKEETKMTVISIAHRLTTLKNSDRILVMEHGEIVQTGKYQELIEKDGIFRQMYEGKLK